MPPFLSEVRSMEQLQSPPRITLLSSKSIPCQIIDKKCSSLIFAFSIINRPFESECSYWIINNTPDIVETEFILNVLIEFIACCHGIKNAALFIKSQT